MANEGRETAEDPVTQIARLRQQVDDLMKDRLTPALRDWPGRDLENAEHAVEETARQVGGRVHEAVGKARQEDGRVVSDTGYDADLEAWGREFDYKIDDLTARQDAFLKYLGLQARRD